MNIIYGAAAGIIGVLSLALWGSYSHGQKLEDKIAASQSDNRLLARQLETLTTAQNIADKETKNEIDSLRAQLANTPIRVRYIRTAPPKSGSSSSCESNQTQADGVLPEGNSKELKRVIAEMEQINAAYASCRNTLINSKIITGKPEQSPAD